MSTIKIIQEQARSIIEPLVAVEGGLEGRLAKANKALDRAGVSGHLYGIGAGLQLDKIIREFRANFAEAVLCVFAHEIGVSYERLEGQDGVADLKDEAEKTLDFETFVKKLDAVVNRDEMQRCEQQQAANRLAIYSQDGIRFKRNELCFSIWASTDDLLGSYGYHVHSSFEEIVRALHLFLRWRGAPFFDRLAEVGHKLFHTRIQSRERINLFRSADNAGCVDIITFKSKMEFRITDELGRDFVAWLKKFADPARLAA